LQYVCHAELDPDVIKRGSRMIIKRLIPIIVVSLVIAFMSQMEGLGGNRPGGNPFVQNGKLTRRAIFHLTQLNQHLDTDNVIVRAESGLISIQDQNDIIREYRIKDGILWVDKNPVLDGISFFHFEYRDKYGNLLTRPHQSLKDIKVIAYTVKVRSRDEDIYTRFRTIRHAADQVQEVKLAVSIP